MNALKDKLCALYKRMSLREKLLSLLFVLVILFLWSNNWLSRLSKLNTQRKLTEVELQTQQQWLDRSDLLTEQLSVALGRVDPSKTFAAAQLSGHIDNLIRSSGLSADIDPVNTREGEIFNDHNLRVRLGRISIAQLIQINSMLQKETPYINIQSIRIQKDRRKPSQLDIRYEINSFDLKDPGL
ncbi:MAG: hypothetical protein VXV91_04945 [Verrucomicrobiota bacterium]|nr:hypothetical protein [Verrucomicrobiota bacterium]